MNDFPENKREERALDNAFRNGWILGCLWMIAISAATWLAYWHFHTLAEICHG